MIDRYQLPAPESVAAAVEELLRMDSVTRITLDLEGGVILVDRDAEPGEEDKQFAILPEELARDAATEELELEFTPLDTLQRATQLLYEDSLVPTHVLVGSRERFFRWLGLSMFTSVLGLPVREVVGYPPETVLIVGSRSAYDPTMGIRKSIRMRIRDERVSNA